MSDTGSPAAATPTNEAVADSLPHTNEDTHADEGAELLEQPQDDDGNEQQDAVDGLEGVDGGDLSDKDSDLLSEIDEDQFDDYRADPVTIDESITKTLKASKRKRTETRPRSPGRVGEPRSEPAVKTMTWVVIMVKAHPDEHEKPGTLAKVARAKRSRKPLSGRPRRKQRPT